MIDKELLEAIKNIPPPVQIINVDGNSCAILQCEWPLKDHEIRECIQDQFAKQTGVGRCVLLSHGLGLKQILQGEADE